MIHFEKWRKKLLNYRKENRLKENYDQKMEEQLKSLQGERKKLLLHSCCGPCSSSVLEYLKDYLEIDVYFYNPNITERKEYETRLEELKVFLKKIEFPMQVLEGKYEVQKDFLEKIKGLEQEPETGARCKICYALRMEEAARKAKEEGYDYFTTVLSISPMKNAAWINEIGENLEQKYGISFLHGDFKKKNRYLRSIQLSKEYGMYRQEYCGCIFSKLERERKQKEREKNG
ncbi:recombinase [Fusobacterium necrophorum BL]|uniref:Epoxyqueuosine reductase QueH n=1 Tax=Fusobacterium necrophorum BL TaxID=1441732 RepID=A0AB73BVW5_9FUSO|nr:recombinase [Fusobacterium necrophorum BL]